MLLSFETITMF